MSGTVQITAAVAGLPPDRVEFLVDGLVRYAKVGEAPFQYTWNTAAARNGTHTVGVRVWGPRSQTPVTAQHTVHGVELDTMPAMRALAIVHQGDAGPGVFADAMRSGGVQLDTWLRAEEELPPRDLRDYAAVLTFGGAMHADQESSHPWLADEKALLRELLERGTPLLGVCLGAQLLAAAAGATVGRAREPEIGWHDVEVTAEGAQDPLLAPLAPGFNGFQWHSYEFALPPGAVAARAQRRVPAGLPVERRGLGHPVPRRGDARGRRGLDRRLPLRRGRGAHRARSRASCGGAPAKRSATGTQLGRELCERFLAAAAVYSGVT